MPRKPLPDGVLPRSTVLSYALASGSGTQFIYAVVGTYLSAFLTDTFGVPAGAVGFIMVAATIWDAVYSLIIGGVADRTNTRFGRYRPYMLILPLPMAIATIALFSCPDLSTGGKIAWSACFYLIYSMLATATQIPIGAIINAVTDREDQRQRMISTYTTTMGIATTVASSFALVLIEAAGKGDAARGYMIVMAAAGALMVLTNWLCFACTKERFISHGKPEPLRVQLKKLAGIRSIFPCILVWCFGFIGFQCMMSASVYYINYYIGNPALIPSYMLVISLIGLMGIVVVIPLFMRWFKGDMKTGFVVSQIGGAVCSLILFFVGGHSIHLLYILSGLGAIFFTMSNAYIPMIVTETIDYVYYKTGEQLNATIGALRGFAVKCGSAISSGVLMFTLSITGYAANAPEQTSAALTGIAFVRFLVPVICVIIVVLCLRTYPVTREIKEKMRGMYTEHS